MVSLLPPNATGEEHAIEKAMRVSMEIEAAISLLPGIKLDNPPDALLPWLVWEYGLTEVAPYIGDYQKVIREGLIWQRNRGTVDALERALGWIDVRPTIEEEEPDSIRWADLQFDPGRFITFRELPAVLALTRLSIPARSKLSRIYHNYDVRRIVLDKSRFGDFLSDYSGVSIDGVVISFGQGHATLASRGDTIIGGVAVSNSVVQARYQDTGLLDQMFFGDLAIGNHPLIHWGYRGFVAGSLAKPDSIHGATICRAQCVPSGMADGLGSINEALAPRYAKETGRTPVLSDTLLSDEPHRIDWIPVDIRLEGLHGIWMLDESDHPVETGRYNARSNEVHYIDTPRLDQMRIEDRQVPNHPVLRRLSSNQWVNDALATPDRVYGRKLSRAQCVLSGTDPLGSINEVLAPRFTEESGRVPLLDDTRLSGEPHHVDWLTIDLRQEDLHGSEVVDESEHPVRSVRFISTATDAHCVNAQHLGRMRLGDQPLQNHPGVGTPVSYRWVNGILDGSYRIYGAKTGKSQCVLSGGDSIGTVNEVLGPRYEKESGRTPVLDDTFLSDEPHRIDLVPVDSRQEGLHGSNAADDGDHPVDTARYVAKTSDAYSVDILRLGQMVIGDAPAQNHPGVGNPVSCLWAGSLAAPERFNGSKTSRAQCVLSGSDSLGSLDETLAPRYPMEIGRTPILDDTWLSSEVHRIDFIPLDTRSERSHGVDALDESDRSVESGRSMGRVLGTACLDTQRLGQMRFGEEPRLNHLSALTHSYHFWANGILPMPDGILGGSLSRAQCVLSGGDPLGVLNGALAPRRGEELGRVPLLSDTLLSDEIHRIELVPIDLRTENQHGIKATDDSERHSLSVRYSSSGYHCPYQSWPVLSFTQPHLISGSVLSKE
uniref:Phage tail protein (Tail_P2_I) n=1 Tax=Candidatus Kentrum sp. LFY TaxID=2126342 RepID=A0A450W6Y3_9GAMM|nr:MAG: Phage tail protein (Tail_P2_I) [Candidatus Kentron sp. LFY]